MRSLLPFALVLLLLGCKKEESVPPPPAPATTAPEPQPAAAAPAPATGAVTLPAGAPIPAEGVLLWLSADDAVPGATTGKVQSWTNALVPNAKATAAHPDRPPAIVADAMNGHAVVRFDGTDQMLMTTVDLRPPQLPEATVITVSRSTTDLADPLRKLYGNDNGSYDRTVGLDFRAPGRNFTLFTGIGVSAYFQLAANTTYVLVDQYSPKEFSGWVNGIAAATKIEANWGEDALPNMYLGGTGTVYAEYWSGDLAEVIVYARKLSDAERMQVEDYLGQKYGVAITR